MAAFTIATASTLAALAIVTQDQAPLRDAPRESAAQQAVLSAGDALELRGMRLGYLQVYDHRRERAGYVKLAAVRSIRLDAAQAPELLAVTRFLRDSPGDESLGIAYAAAYLKAVPVSDLGAEPFDAIGVMAERLARRANARAVSPTGSPVAAQLEAAAAYGVRFTSFAIPGDADGRMRLCYDGEAYGRVLALPGAAPAQRARAVLALTREDCIDPALPQSPRQQIDRQRSEWLVRIEPAAFAELDEATKNALRFRRAEVASGLAFGQAQRLGPAAAASEGSQALAAIVSVNRSELSDDDALPYAEAALRAGASRWAAVAPVDQGAQPLKVELQVGEPGQTCVLLRDAKKPSAAPLAQRCTWGVVWAASARARPAGDALALAVQPLATWRELWVFRRQGAAWTIDVLPPSANGPDLGYIEFAGWVPGSRQMLVARESRERVGNTSRSRIQRRFEVLNLDTLAVDKSASDPSLLVLFGRWQDPAWRSSTVSLR
jgi:hypothetical protein